MGDKAEINIAKKVFEVNTRQDSFISGVLENLFRFLNALLSLHGREGYSRQSSEGLLIEMELNGQVLEKMTKKRSICDKLK